MFQLLGGIPHPIYSDSGLNLHYDMTGYFVPRSTGSINFNN
jgi:hypothetical protein